MQPARQTQQTGTLPARAKPPKYLIFEQAVEAFANLLAKRFKDVVCQRIPKQEIQDWSIVVDIFNAASAGMQFQATGVTGCVYQIDGVTFCTNLPPDECRNVPGTPQSDMC